MEGFYLYFCGSNREPCENCGHDQCIGALHLWLQVAWGPHVAVQGYLAHEQTYPPGPYRRPMPRVVGGPRGWAFSHGRGTPVFSVDVTHFTTGVKSFRILMHGACLERAGMVL